MGLLAALPTWDDVKDAGAALGEAVGLGAGGQGLALPDDPDAARQQLGSMPEEQRLQALEDLLAQGWIRGPSDENVRIAREVLADMSPEGRRAFVEGNPDGFDTIVGADSAPSSEQESTEQETNWADSAREWIDWGSDMARAAWNDPGQAMNDLGDTTRAWGEHASDLTEQTNTLARSAVGGEGVDLNALQALGGGSLGGLELDENQRNTLEFHTDTRDGRFEARLPSLALEGFSYDEGGVEVEVGSGNLTDAFVAVDLATAAGADAMVEAGVGKLNWSDISVLSETDTSGLHLVVPHLVVAALHLQMTKSGVAPEAVSTDLLVSQVMDQLTFLARSLLEKLPALSLDGPGISDEASFTERLASAFSGQQDVSMSVGELTLGSGLTCTTTDAEGAQHTTSIDTLVVQGLAISLEQQQTLTALQSEMATLESMQDLTATQRERLTWIGGEIARLNERLALKNSLLTRQSEGEVLTSAEQDELILIERELRSGVATVELAFMETEGVDAAGHVTGRAEVEGVRAQVTSAELGWSMDQRETVDEKTTRLDAALGIEAPAEDASVSDDPSLLGEGVLADVKVASAFLGDASATGAHADFARIDGLSATVTGDAADARVDGIALSGATYDGSAVDEARATGIVAGVDGSELVGGIDTASVKDLTYDDGETSARLGAASLDGARIDANTDTFDVRSASLESAEVRDAWYGSDETVAYVARAAVRDVAVEDATAAGTGDLGVGQASVQAALYADGDTTAFVGAADAHGIDVRRGNEGTVARLDGASASDVHYASESGDTEASLGGFSVGASGIVLDADDSLVGARVDGLTLDDIHVELLRYALDSDVEAGANPSDASDASDRFHADALASASGTFRAVIPYGQYGIGDITIVVPATDGQVHVGGIDIQATRRKTGQISLWNHVDKAERRLRVEKGRGLVAQILGINLAILMDSRDWSGLRADSGKDDRGGILLQPFVESMMSATVTGELSPEAQAALSEQSEQAQRREARREDRQEARATRKQERWTTRLERIERRGSPNEKRKAGLHEKLAGDPTEGMGNQELLDYYDDVYMPDSGIEFGAIQLHLDGLQLGDGDLGYDSALATLSGASEGANRFTLHGNLGDSMHLGANVIDISALAVDMGEGQALDVRDLGISGLQVTIDKPISVDRTLSVGVEGFEIRSIRLGDTGALEPEESTT